MAQPVWLTPAGNLGTYPEGVFFQFSLLAEEPDLGDTIYYQVIAGSLPAGVQVAANGLIVGIPKAIANVQGVPLEVARDITSRFAVRAYTTKTVGSVTVINRLADRTFSITVSGQDDPEFVTPAGNIATVFDGTLITDLQLEYTDSDTTDITITRLAGGTLPPGTSLSLNGLITGFVIPQAPNGATAGFSRDGQGFSQYPFDFPTQSNSATYEFVVELTDGKSSALRTFNIQVLSRDSLTADSTDITADNTFVTADGTPVRVPVLLTLPGSIGIVRSDNYFAFKFNGIQADGFAVVYATDSDAALAAIGLELDPGTGWLYGYIPDQGLQENTYNFKIRVYQSGEPDVSSVYSDFSLTVQGPIDTEITWLTPASAVGRALVPSPLGTIVNGSTSQLYVEALNASGVVLEYRLKSGSDSNLPQGLRLLPSGEIAGRCSFNTFALDGGTTTFDVASNSQGVSAPTTFDLTFTFTVEAYSSNTQIRVDKVFSITVNRQYNEPYENLYIQAMPPQDDRDLVNSLLQNPTIIPPTLLYRGDDSNFGRATKVVYQHAFGLTAATYEDYVSSLYENHYWKNLVLGSIETAQATDDNGNVIYEVVYSRVIGGQTNNRGESVSKEVVLPYPIATQQIPLLVDGQILKDPAAATTPTVPLALKSNAWLEEARDLNMLANIGSQMARDWMIDGQPGDPQAPGGSKVGIYFDWTPSNQCDVNALESTRYNKFKTSLLEVAASRQIIWSEYTVTIDGKEQTNCAPFGFLINPAGSDTAYLVLRGTQTAADGKLDIMPGKVPNPVGGFGSGLTAKGFSICYTGLGPQGHPRSATTQGISLQEALENTTATKIHLGGHSLGSAVVTLVTAYAQSLNKFDVIKSYPSASPTVGNQKFADWFDELEDRNGNTMGANFWRVTNVNDTVPLLPGSWGGFFHVGETVEFNARYTLPNGVTGDTALNHQICCCYAYALQHPIEPFNEKNQDGTCTFPKGTVPPPGAFDTAQHLTDLQNFYINYYSDADQLITTVYPNSLENMRNQVIDTVGQVSALLPRWMLSTQTNGRVLGFTPAWVIAYVTPGNGEQIAYNIRTQFGTQLNLVDFEVDRYELDKALTTNWDPVTEQWIPQPPAETTFDNDAHYQLPEPNDSSFVFNGGLGYAVGNTIKILGSQVGGVDVTNDIVVTVQQVDEFGTIEQAIGQGTAPLLSVGNTYVNIVGSNITGTGTGATWDIEVTGEDPTVFDAGSLRFIQPTIIATDTTDYDKYLVFPYRTILG
jgi:hypothetical protein